MNEKDWNWFEKLLAGIGFEAVVVFFRALNVDEVTNVQGAHESGKDDLPLTKLGY